MANAINGRLPKWATDALKWLVTGLLTIVCALGLMAWKAQAQADARIEKMILDHVEDFERHQDRMEDKTDAILHALNR